MPDPRRGSTVIVVPCYNEAERLEPDRFAAFAAAHPGVRFLFVNDGSTDRTADVLRKLERSQPHAFRTLHLRPNAGKGEAVRQGMLVAMASGAGYAGYWDADLSTPLDAIPEFVAILDERPSVELVMGARVQLLGRRIERRAARHYAGRVFATAASAVLGLPVYDTQCGAKLFRVTDGLRSVFVAPFGSRWVFDVELLARFARLERGSDSPATGAVVEVPLEEWHDVAGSRLRLRDFVKAGLDLWWIWRRYGRGLRSIAGWPAVRAGRAAPTRIGLRDAS